MRQGRRRRVRNVASAEGPGNKLLALSLFIMLLAFFIVLNAISTFEEEKVEPIVASLEAAFASKVTASEDVQPSVTKSKQHSINEGNSIERIEALFRSRIPAKNIDKNEHLGTMQVTMTLEEFENIVSGLSQGRQFGEERTSEQAEVFLATLVSLLRSDQLGTPYHMDIIVNIAEKPSFLQNSDPQKMADVMRQASLLTTRIEQYGLSAKLMTIGLQKGDDKTVDLLFRPYVPFDPLVPGSIDVEAGTNYE